MYNSLLFVGDVHLSSIKPGRRTDDYVESIFHKLEQIKKYSIENNALVIFTGDLFHKGEEKSLTLLNKTILYFSGFDKYLKPYLCLGNHDISNDKLLTDDYAISLLKNSSLLNVVDEIIEYNFLVNSDNIRIIFIPWGKEIPKKLSYHNGITVMVTHHDISFDGNSYPELIDPFYIENCNFVYNGHIHKKFDNIVIENLEQSFKTVWINNGSLTRNTIAEFKHIPKFYSFTKDNFEEHIIEYKKDCFDFTGYQVEKMDEESLIQQGDFLNLNTSQAANLIFDTYQSLSISKTDDASVLKEHLEDSLSKKDFPDLAKQIVWELYNKVVPENKS